MNNPIPRVPVTAIRTAVTVMNSTTDPTLCPFFGKCDGIVIIDAASGSKVFHPNVCRTPQSLCDLIEAAEPDRVVCGYIGETEKRRLRAAGIDIRLGSCTCSIDELSACFQDLPEA